MKTSVLKMLVLGCTLALVAPSLAGGKEKGAGGRRGGGLAPIEEALAKLSHPNIVTVHDFGEADGLFFLLMEFVDGMTLRQLLHEGLMKPEAALAIVESARVHRSSIAIST